MVNQELLQKIGVVTGGSRGIGAAVAIALAAGCNREIGGASSICPRSLRKLAVLWDRTTPRPRQESLG